METGRESSTRKVFWLSGALLLALCSLFIALRWGKLNSLWGDPARWLFEAYRAAQGETLYRDFAWQFPPLSLLLMSGAFRLLGSTFETAQIVLNGLSVIVVLLLWAVARRILSAGLALATTLAGVIAIATGGGPDFRLFSLQLYTPAQLTGLIGTLLLLWSMIAALQSGRLTTRGWIALSLGSTIGLLSKPEYAAACVGGLIVFVLVEARTWFFNKSIGSWLRHMLPVLIAGLLPAAIGYLVVGGIVGFDNLMAGVTGYGAAALICPWWPTGLGLLGALFAVGQGVLFIALLSLARFNVLRRKYGRRYFAVWLAATGGLLLMMLYVPAWLRLNNFRLTTWQDVLGFVTTLGVVLLPVMWFSIGVWFGLAGRYAQSFFKRQAFPFTASWLWVLITIGVVLSARGLFGDSHSITTMVSVAAMPVWLIVGPYGLLRILQQFKTDEADQGRALWSKVVLAVVVGYAGLRLIYGLSDEARTSYTTLNTPAGTVQLMDQTSVTIYDYVVRHTAADEPFLDVAYGGGINFALRRSSPTFSTQWWYLLPPQKYVDQDMAQFLQHPPSLVIANELSDYGASFGVNSPTRCPFPRLVWRPDEAAYDPARRFAVLDFIQVHYQPVFEKNGGLVLQPAP
jgi:hypothetical protein